MSAPECQGKNLVIIGSAASTHLDEDTKSQLSDIDADQWYPASQLETIIEQAIAAGPRIGRIIGRSVIYAIKKDLKHMGVDSPESALRTLPQAYESFNRGDGIGQWQPEVNEGSAVISDTTLYDCRFNQGIIEGMVLAFGGRITSFEHQECRRDGAEACRSVITWSRR
jgi:hypothetical protein